MTRVRPSTPAPLAALSHEFRTPLNGVLGMARLLEGTRLTAEQRSYVAALKQSGDHLLSLVNDVLDLAKLDAGSLTLNTAPTRIDQLLQTVAELLSPRAHDKGLEIAWAVPPGLPPIMADEGRLKQVLFNLAGNAVKFTTTGGILLSAEMSDRAEGGLTVRFEVRDTGPGVPVARQKPSSNPSPTPSTPTPPAPTAQALACPSSRGSPPPMAAGWGWIPFLAMGRPSGSRRRSRPAARPTAPSP